MKIEAGLVSNFQMDVQEALVSTSKCNKGTGSQERGHAQERGQGTGSGLPLLHLLSQASLPVALAASWLQTMSSGGAVRCRG